MFRCIRDIAVLILSFSLLCLSGCQNASRSTGERVFCLNGLWQFTADKSNEGIEAKWFAQNNDRSSWQEVKVPHTWQVMPGLEDYHGVGWYYRNIKIDAPVKGKIVKLQFDAVNRDTQVWVNGRFIGEHNGSGYTPFDMVIPNKIITSNDLHIAVRVANNFSKRALPFDRSYDWITDGGIVRGVRLKILPTSYIEQPLIDAQLSADYKSANIDTRVVIKGKSSHLSIKQTILDPSGNIVNEISAPIKDNDGNFTAFLEADIKSAALWHFDRPQLYRMICNLIDNGKIIHTKESSFGIRKVEVKDGFYILNGEKMRLMGLEWMPGSDPRYGLAETPEYMQSVLEDMKKLNCVITRFHWQQDDYVFKFMDEEGMLVQEEIPTWGPGTRLEQLADIQQMQTNEMILPHYNHPSIYAWGLCNEITGQAPQGHKFVKDGIALAKKLNPQRLLTYASNTIHENPKKDAAQYLDFIEWNEYFESWMGGDVSVLARHASEIENTYPDKTLVVSEYGLCECSPKNPTGDDKRIEILKNHTNEFRKHGRIAGAIFFCYNDYRTHMGDKCTGVFRQRVHGIVDLLNQPKPSWQAFREECSPVKSITITAGEPNNFNIDVLTRSLENDFPAYTLRDYVLVWRALDTKNVPVQSGRKILPELKPGTTYREAIKISRPGVSQIKAEVFRPTGYSVLDNQLNTRAQ